MQIKKTITLPLSELYAVQVNLGARKSRFRGWSLKALTTKGVEVLRQRAFTFYKSLCSWCSWCQRKAGTLWSSLQDFRQMTNSLAAPRPSSSAPNTTPPIWRRRSPGAGDHCCRNIRTAKCRTNPVLGLRVRGTEDKNIEARLSPCHPPPRTAGNGWHHGNMVERWAWPRRRFLARRCRELDAARSWTSVGIRRIKRTGGPNWWQADVDRGLWSARLLEAAGESRGRRGDRSWRWPDHVDIHTGPKRSRSRWKAL